MLRYREAYGTCSAVFVVLGMLYGAVEVFGCENNANQCHRIRSYAKQYKENHDTIICRELMQRLNATCPPRVTHLAVS
ncbi:C-GCAxxG-C-C family protein [Ruminococcus albus]|uniref:C-GCAxxG-C-C family protein n=1 Tax=Ruminococcus albus TaxID=1264 RepID=UPI001FA911CF|nr:C-GCAxxG-C-C family protein [Ruminococcus albus]